MSEIEVEPKVEPENELEKRTEKLKPFLYEILKIVSELQNKEEDFQLSGLLPIPVQVFVGLKDKEKKKIFLENGIDSEKIIAELNQILEDDNHLHKCCVTYDRLAAWLDRFISEVLRLTQGEMPDQTKFDEFFNQFSEITYKEPFRAVVYSHIFNFISDEDTLEFGDFQIQKLDLARRFDVLGDNSTLVAFHPHDHIGTHFIVATGSELIENDWDWLFNERIKAEDIARIFQYYKDGVVHINYSAVHFYPEWVNPIRNGGIFFYGQQRRFPHEMGGKMYSLNQDEYKEIIDWFTLYQLPEVIGKFDLETKKKSDLGQKIELAGIYFEASHTHHELVRRLIDLAIALEVIFHPYGQNEIAFQISQLAAQVLGTNPTEKNALFRDIKLMYTKRSDVFHGNIINQNKKPVTLEEIERWSSFIRRSLLTFITLYIRDNEEIHKPDDSHIKIIERIRNSFFDSDELERLEKEWNIRLLIEEFKEKYSEK